ncbi:MDR/zinc-dependent alcohol dehydrogenase-like family protein [Tsukamurella soli]|uniref:Alcohol dehydrogenase GroES-like domain-containing protein n=1 Tax=Tsukamurella soli TaxID=644556 RepID=A0ABP8JPH2_9ACTN
MRAMVYHAPGETRWEHVTDPVIEQSTDAIVQVGAVTICGTDLHILEVGVLNGRVRPGSTVVVVGVGPIGLAAIMTARLYSPGHIVAVDRDQSRLAAAHGAGADTVVHVGREDVDSVVGHLTGGLGPTSPSRRSDAGCAQSAATTAFTIPFAAHDAPNASEPGPSIPAANSPTATAGRYPCRRRRPRSTPRHSPMQAGVKTVISTMAGAPNVAA